MARRRCGGRRRCGRRRPRAAAPGRRRRRGRRRRSRSASSGVAPPAATRPSTRRLRAGPAPAPCAARSSARRAIAGSSCAGDRLTPAAMRWPPPRAIRPSRASRATAAPRSTPLTERPEPLPSAPWKPMTTAGRPKVSLSRAATMPTTPGVPAGAGGPDQRAVGAAPAACASAAARTAASIVPALGVEPSSRAGERRRLVRVGGREEPRPEVGRADAAAGVDPRPEHEAERLGGRRAGQPRRRRQRGEPRPLAPGHDLEALPHQRPVQAGRAAPRRRRWRARRGRGSRGGRDRRRPRRASAG